MAKTQEEKQKEKERKERIAEFNKKVSKFRNPFKKAVSDKGLNYANAHLAFWEQKDDEYAMRGIGIKKEDLILTIKNVIIDYKLKNRLKK